MDSTEKLVFEKLTPLDDHDIGIYKSAILLHSERNVIDYFNFKGEIDSILIGFINKADIEFDFSEKNTGLSEAKRSMLFDSFINCNGLADDKYSAIMSSLGIEKASFDIANIDDSKVMRKH